MAVKDVKKVVLAYSGGLDTSVILRWLQTTYGCEVVTFPADLGQGEELGPARKKAEMFGVKEIFVDDLRACCPAITALDLRPDEMGRRLAGLLHSLLDSALPHGTVQVVQARLIVRASTSRGLKRR